MMSVMLALSLVLLASCGSNDDSGEGSSDNESSDIKFMNYFTEGDDSAGVKAQRKMVKKFEEENPDINIDSTKLSHDGYFDKIKTLAAGNELPDVFIAQGSMIQSFADGGLIKPLNKILDKHPDWKDGFVEGSLDTFKYKNKFYGIPFNGGPTHVIYYNKDILSDVGYDKFPSTWDDFLDLIDKLKDKGVTPISLGNKDKFVLQSVYLSTLGNRFTGTDWFNNLLKDKGAKFTDPEFVKSLKTLKNLADNGAFNDDMNSLDDTEQMRPYYKGKAAMTINGNWGSEQIEDNAPDDIYKATDVAIFPKVPNEKGPDNAVAGGAGGAYVINANVSDEKEKKIVKFLQKLTGEKSGETVIKEGGLPIVQVDDVEKYDMKPLEKKVYNLVQDSEYVDIYDSKLSPSVVSKMEDDLQKLVIDKESPEQVAKDIQSEYEKQ